MKILILDGDNFQALRIVRDIGNNHMIFVGGKSKRTTLAYYSKYCDGFIEYNDEILENFKNVLLKIKTERIELIIPTTERSCIILNQYRKNIEEINDCVIAMDTFENLEIAFDKSKTYSFCKRNGIPTPEIDFFDSSNLKTEIVVLKDTSSNILLKDGTIKKTSSPKYFKNTVSHLNKDKFKFFQEFIRGKSIGYFAICKEGKIIDSYSHIRILDTNPSGSGSCVRKSVTNLPYNLKVISEKIIEKLNWNGPIMLEFLQDEIDQYYLLEINGRLWGSYCLSSYSGKNFTSKLLSLFTNEICSEESEKKDIVVTNEILLISRWLRIMKGASRYSSEKFPNRSKILYELKFLRNKKEILSDYDPLPIFRYLWKK